MVEGMRDWTDDEDDQNIEERRKGSEKVNRLVKTTKFWMIKENRY